MMKKVYLSILVLFMATLGLSAQNPQVKIGNVTSGPGVILVPFEMFNFTQPVNSFTFKITANSSLLQFVEVVNRVGFTGPNFQAHQNGNTLTIVYFDIGSGYTPNGKVFDLKFNYSAAANTVLAFQPNQQEVTSGINPIPGIVFTNGNINSNLPVPDPVVDIADVTVAPGAVNLGVEMLHFTQNVTSFTFNINLPSNLLQFVDLQNVNPSLANGTLQTSVSGNLLKVEWSTTGTGFIPSGNIFNLRVNYIGGFNTDITWLQGSEVKYGLTAVNPITFIKGHVAQVPAVGTVTVGSVSAVTNSAVSVPILFNGNGFTNVSAFTLFTQYDPSRLTYVGVSGAFSNDIIVNHNSGVISLAWAGATTNLSNNATAILLNFIYTGISPALIEFLPGSEVTNALAINLPVSFQNGNVSPQASASVIQIETVAGFAGQNIQVPINVTNLGVVGEIDLYLSWNPQQATLAEGIVNQLSNWTHTLSPGSLNIKWSNSLGSTVNDGPLVTLIFSYHGGGNMPISFTSGSVIKDINGQNKVVNFQNGGINQNFSNSQTIIGTITNCANNVALVPVSLSQVGPITSFSFSIGYDPTVLTYINLQNIHPSLTGLVVNQVGNAINIQWQNMVAVNFTTKLFDLAFDYYGPANTVVYFNPGSEITGVNAMVLPVTYVNGAVNCNIQTRVLTLDISGSGNVVVKDGATVLLPDANTTNQYTVPYGKELTLIASGNTGWAFASWNGPVLNVNSAVTTIIMNNNANVVANFNLIPYTLTLTAYPVAGGIVSGSGTFTFGQNVSVSATPNVGYSFVNWTDDANNVVSTSAVYSFNMPASNVALTANFALIDYTVSLASNPAMGGTVTGGGTYNFNQVVTVNATPSTGYAFLNWKDASNNIVSTTASYSFNMPASNVELTANFELINYTVTVNANPVAGGVVSGGGSYTYGQNVTVQAIANTGYTFLNWTTPGGNVVSTSSTYSFTMPAENYALTANFTLNSYTVALSANPSAGGIVTGSGTYLFDANVIVNAVANTGYSFVNWTTASGTVVSTNPSYGFIMPSNNVELVANFSLNSYTLTLTANPAIGGNVTGAGTYNFGQQVSVVATANTGYDFINWTNSAGTVVSTTPTYNFSMPAANLELFANFQLAYVAPFPFSENFDGTTFPPQYWGRYRQGTGTTVREWVRSTAQNQNAGGLASAFHNYGPSTQTEDGWLITPKIQLPTGSQEVQLRFWSYNTFPTDYGKNSVLISTTNGTPGAAFTEVWTTASVTQAWVETIVNLNAYKGQQVFIAFRYQGSDAHGWHLDNVTVNYAPVPTPVITVNPANLTATVELGTTGTKTLTVGNTGTGPLNFNVNIQYANNATSFAPVEQPAVQGGRALLFDNGPFVNNPGAGSGGSDLSQLHSGMTTFGSSANYNNTGGYFSVAEDFTVDQVWHVSSFTFYGYQTSTTHPTPPVSTFTSGRLRIWNGVPGAAGSNVIWGDLANNLMSATSWTNAYRVSETVINNQRPIMAIVCATPGLTLQPGSYWVEYSLTGTIASGPWVVPITINGQTTTGNAKQYNGTTQTWTDLIMGGTNTPYGLPFKVEGTAVPPQIQWLSVSPASGTVAPAANTSLTVGFNPAGLEVGTYSATINITSNDPITPTKAVPVTMTVTPSTICYPEPLNLTSSVTNQNVVLSWQAPNLGGGGGGGGGGGTVKLDEGFEGDFPPTGWIKMNPDNGTGWTSLVAGTTPIPSWQGGTATPAPNGGNKMAFANYNTGGSTANNQWIVTPQITVAAGDQLKFYMRYAFNSYNDNLDVRISTQSQNNPAHFTTIVEQFSFTSTSSTEWQLKSYNLTDFVPAGSQIYIAFREHVLDNINDGSAIMLDNVYVGPATRMPEPIVYGLPSSMERGNAQSATGLVYNGSVGESEIDISNLRGEMPSGIRYEGAGSGRAILFDNGPFVNNPGAGPDGSDLSQLHSGMTTFGSSANYNNTGGYFSVADDFVVPEVWNVESFTFYGYQTSTTHPTPPVSTFTSGRLRIWNGEPGVAGSTVVWGDLADNLMTATSWTNAYRVSETVINNQRPIMRIVCSTPGLVLQPGSYWVEYSLTGTIASGPWVVPITINGQTTTGNAKQYNGTTQTWTNLLMGGTNTPYGLPFLVEGTVGGGGGCNHGELLGYKVYRNNQLIGQTPASVRTYTDNNVTPGTYTYGVTAVYGQPYPGESQAVTTSVTVQAASTFPFEETWASGNFTQNQWTFQPSQGNWRIATAAGNPAPSVEFYWSPTTTAYSQSLISRDINATNAVGNVTLQFDIFLDDYANNGNEQMKVYIWNGTTWVLLDTFTNTADIPWTTKTYNVTSHALGKITKVRFEATGATTFDIDWWRIDNIKVFQGAVQNNPVITVNPDNMYHYFFTPGGLTTKTLNIGNTGQAPLNWSATIQYTREDAPAPVIVPGGDKDIPGLLDIAHGTESETEAPEIIEPSRNPVVLNYDGDNATGIGLTNGGTFHVAARFPSTMVAQYAGHKLTSVQVYIRDLPTSVVLKIWGAGTSTAPGTLLREQSFTAQANAWNTITLTNQLTLEGTDLWVGYTVTHAASAFPAGMDAGPANPNGDWISTDGTSWSRLNTLVTTINRNWNIRATLIPGVTYNWLTMAPPTSGIINPGSSVNKNMLFNSTGLTPGRYTASIRITSNDPVTPVKIVPVIMDITVGVDEQQMSDIRVYPVPTNGLLNLKLVEGIEMVRVMNAIGQVVMERSLSGKLSDVLNLQGLNAGAYTLQFVNNTGRTFNRTIVVTK